MKVSIDKEIVKTLPAFKIGLNHYTKITVSESPQMLKGRLQLFQEQLFFELDDKAVTEFQGVQEWREVWKAFGANPSRYRSSIEALLRRIGKQNYLQPVNSSVDMNNFFSLQYEIPMGIYDTQRIQGDIAFNIGTSKTTLEGLNGRLNHVNNMIVLSDNIGPFGSPFVDSKRTAVSEITTSAVHVFFLRPSMDTEEAAKLLTAAGKMFTNVHGGEVCSKILHKEQPSTILD
ncbi:B3/4 domain-containing protein [Sporosarcina pasteurii]|uniref:Phenylalanyl-tRNA synthetase subunit beta n=1 Tax=Sporosarcina pasteurii TaxID=1474 RepID=A0A380CCI2_SPOPA|nr:phenylalanine--tRNA ligase beta subunit-related protein [Sporosarcina pasteurii]MDS9472639.1 phenylalanine--tRNA ligase beta subunit-related protein [Sporosarcina pasteurii]QBQ04301.1 hypothetical protein E2C16_00630 [Sporosarcina pasteurii]SUJ16608.1 phenylalanyl-tRNA synthetase subunit beta [Sporosarcina pasteurii]